MGPSSTAPLLTEEALGRKLTPSEEVMARNLEERRLKALNVKKNSAKGVGSIGGEVANTPTLHP